MNCSLIPSQRNGGEDGFDEADELPHAFEEPFVDHLQNVARVNLQQREDGFVSLAVVEGISRELRKEGFPYGDFDREGYG